MSVASQFCRCAVLRLPAGRWQQPHSTGQVIVRTTLRRSTTKGDRASDAQTSAYKHYRQQQESSLWYRLLGKRMAERRKRLGHSVSTQAERNVTVAWYAAAVIVGALGASYASVPLYKVFCQTTGFGGTTQRALKDDEGSGLIDSLLQKVATQLPVKSGRVHSWTDEEAAAKLASMKPVKNAELITVRFDTTVSDILPWTFEPVQLDVKIVPGETALSFFRVTNKSDQAITGVATYNVHPSKVGVYFQKIQCFCFEEQRLLPGETVDMPVFFFIDPEMLNDPQVAYVRSVTLSYTFFQTDIDDEDDLADDDETDTDNPKVESEKKP